MSEVNAPRKVGRPRESIDGKGNPELRCRVSQEIAEWVKAQGGSEWLRLLVEREHGKFSHKL